MAHSHPSTRSRWIRREGTDLHVLDTAGAGPPVLLLHGLAGSARELLPTARVLAPLFRLFLVDQRGHGHSTTHPREVTREAFVADTVAVIEELAGGPVHLVGQSMGAHTAFLTAAARPDLVDRLVMLEGHAQGGNPDDAARLGDFFRSWPEPFPSTEAARDFLGERPITEAWVSDLEETAEGLSPRFDPDVMEGVLRAVCDPRWSEWESLVVPTLAVFAENGMFPGDERDALIARRPATHRVDLPGASHDAHLDAFDPWIRTLKEWLTRPL